MDEYNFMYINIKFHRKEEILSFEATWMNLENIMPGEKANHCIISRVGEN